MKHIKLKKHEEKTKKRLDGIYKVSKVLNEFFDKGFRTYEKLELIVLVYYPEISKKDLWSIWIIRSYDEVIIEKLNDVLGKLKSEKDESIC